MIACNPILIRIFGSLLTCLNENIIRCRIWMHLFNLSFSYIACGVIHELNFSHKGQDCSDTLVMFARDFIGYLGGC